MAASIHKPDPPVETPSPCVGSWGGPTSEKEFWKQAAAASELHRHIVKRHRLRTSRECAIKAVKVWQALSDLEDLLTAMDQQYIELQAEGTDDLDGLTDDEWRTPQLL